MFKCRTTLEDFLNEACHIDFTVCDGLKTVKKCGTCVWCMNLLAHLAKCIGGSSGGRGSARRTAPQWSRFFPFNIQNFRNVTISGVNVPLRGRRPPPRKILDPPLKWVEDFMYTNPKLCLHLHIYFWQSYHHNIQLCQWGKLAHYTWENLYLERRHNEDTSNSCSIDNFVTDLKNNSSGK